MTDNFKPGDKIEGVHYAGEEGAHTIDELEGSINEARELGEEALIGNSPKLGEVESFPVTAGSSNTITIKNTDGGTMPAYSVGEVTSIDSSDVYQIRKPTTANIEAALLVFNGSSEILTNEEGDATQSSDGLGQVIADTMTAASHYGTDVNAWTLVKDNNGLIALGVSSGGTEVLVRPFDFWRKDIKIKSTGSLGTFNLTGAFTFPFPILQWRSENFVSGPNTYRITLSFILRGTVIPLPPFNVQKWSGNMGNITSGSTHGMSSLISVFSDIMGYPTGTATANSQSISWGIGVY